MSEQLTACISGSFAFKPEIDGLIDEFADYGVRVTEPTKGWLYLPNRLPEPQGTFRPLPLERGLEADEVERRFLTALQKAHFVYLHNQCSYIGVMTSLELGYAIGKEKPVYATTAVTPANFEYDLSSYEAASDYITIATPQEAAEAARAHFTAST